MDIMYTAAFSWAFKNEINAIFLGRSFLAFALTLDRLASALPTQLIFFGVYPHGNLRWESMVGEPTAEFGISEDGAVIPYVRRPSHLIFEENRQVI